LADGGRGSAARRAHVGKDENVVFGDDSVMRRSHALQEMMAFARAIIEDGEVSDSEAAGFRAWVEANPDVLGIPQLDPILDVLANFFADGRLSDVERERLAQALERFGG
jgi:hypothetical protein